MVKMDKQQGEGSCYGLLWYLLSIVLTCSVIIIANKIVGLNHRTATLRHVFQTDTSDCRADYELLREPNTSSSHR